MMFEGNRTVRPDDATTLGAAMERAGIDRDWVALDKVLALLFNHGRSKDEIKAHIDAYEMPSEGREYDARLGQHETANARLPNEGEEGHDDWAGKANLRLPTSPSPQGKERGHQAFADKAGHGMSRSLPSKSPTVGQVSALGRARQKAAETILSAFDKYKTADGRRWSQICYHELEGMVRDGDIARALRDKIGIATGKQYYAPLPEVIKEADFLAIMRGGRHVS